MTKSVAKPAQLRKEPLSALFVLAPEDLVENDETKLDVPFLAHPVRYCQAKAQVGEILLASGESREFVFFPPVDDDDAVVVREPNISVAAVGRCI